MQRDFNTERQKLRISSLFKLFIIYFFGIAIIYNSGYALITVNNEIALMLLMLATFFVLIIVLSDKKILHEKLDNYFLVYLGLMFGWLLTLISNWDFGNIISYLRLPFVLTLSYCVTRVFPFEKFICVFIKVMKVVVYCSLVSYVAFNLLDLTVPFPIVENVNGVRYYNAIVNFVMAHAPDRNTGIFWEPGIFSSFLSLAMIIEICFNKKINKFNLVLFCIAILTTKSTAGYLFLPLIGILLLNRTKESQLIIILNILLLIIFLGVYFQFDTILLYLSTLYPEIFGKVVNESGSYSTRVNGPLIDLKIFIHKPLFGVGFKDYYQYWSNMAKINGVSSQTSTITYFLASMGIPGVLYFYTLVSGILKLKNINLNSKITILTIFLFIVTKEPHQHNVAMYMFLFYFMREPNVLSDSRE